jgi:hypothetical protein
MNVKVFNLVSNLISLVVTILTILVLSIGSNVTAQTTLDPTTQDIEIFFDSQYRDIAKCVKKAYKQNNGNRIDLSYTFDSETFTYDTNRIKDTLEQRCSDLNVNNIIDSDLETVVYCLDEIELIPGVGWKQVYENRLDRCLRATKNTLGIHRQAFVDCVIRNRFNPDTLFLDKNLSSDLTTLCVEEQKRAFVFPKNIDYYNALIYCLDHNKSQPKLLKSGLNWDWEKDGDSTLLSRGSGTLNCRWLIQDFSELRMRTPTELGIGFGAGSEINLPNLNFNPTRIDVPTEQTCWISKEGMNVGPNLTNIWNPGNWLPIMYKCQNTTSDGRPIPLHPINLIPIAIRLFAFITSLLIWLIVINIIVGIILFIVGVAKSILAWVKNILIGSVAVVIVLVFMYFILYLILSIFQGSS